MGTSSVNKRQEISRDYSEIREDNTLVFKTRTCNCQSFQTKSILTDSFTNQIYLNVPHD